MQFSTLALIAFVASAVKADNATVTEESSTLITITSCAPTVTNCPAIVSTSLASNSTPANVTTYEGGANKFAAAGAAALAAGALLAL